MVEYLSEWSQHAPEFETWNPPSQLEDLFSSFYMLVL